MEASVFGSKGVFGGHGDDCSDEVPCLLKFQCDKLQNKCVCPRIGHRLTSFYHEKQEKCMSAVGKMCVLDVKKKEEDDGLWKIECVPYSECVRPEGAGSNMPDLFGVCTCQAGFEEDDKHTCRPAMMMIQIGSGDSMVKEAQAEKKIGMQEWQDGATLPTKEDRERDPKAGDSEIMTDDKKYQHLKPMPTKPTFGVDSLDETHGLVVPKSDLDGWEHFDPAKPTNSGANGGKYVQLNICVLVAVKLVLFLFW